jgi:Zn-dependent protease with chaperone function
VNFFDAQDKARRLTRWLVIVYGVATLLIIAGVTLVFTAAFYGLGQQSRPPDPELLIGIAGLTLLIIVGATLYRTARLASGGGRVAAELGGTRLDADESDPLRRRLRNVVEEMAIASGVPVPEIYVLEQEQGINAFAAGFTPDDAAVAVTRGTLELLTRDELQGVIAHEFSHILNGDMRLNIRMMGVLFGIMVIGLIGRTILRGTRRGVRVSGRDRNGGIVLVGLGLTILGWIGVFFARTIKAAVSRQREYLADASAVQFTRQTDGIANALKKIGGYSGHSYLQAADAEEISHMLFALGSRFTGLFATHPPLTERIRALDPQFDESEYPEVRRPGPGKADTADARAAGFADTAAVGTAPDAVLRSIGQPGPEHVAYAAALHASIPEELLAPAHSPEQAYLVALALLLEPDASTARRQLDFLGQQLGDDRAALVRRYHGDVLSLGARYRLPLLELVLPALRRTKEGQQQFLLDLARKLVEHDGVIDLREFCLYRVLRHSLEQSARPSRRPAGGRPQKAAVRRAAVSLINLLADLGNDSDAARQRAFDAGRSRFGRWSQTLAFQAVAGSGVDEFRAALDVLRRVSLSARRTLIEAATSTVLVDGRVTIPEAEMLRTVCASLGCPMPPIPSAAES